ncbi:thermonuclease family protein [Metamycoplasma auris]|uniref:Micrococcal nuclease n=1 Tax=Metamycoplasma auris TaxID=51363 RepID=A0A2W7FZL3_9BACT|nr:thermonuclease family protein [Metamycoplasma auris]PZV99859.1 micrococcal nuclease [Metamycoplasma auris]
MKKGIRKFLILSPVVAILPTALISLKCESKKISTSNSNTNANNSGTNIKDNLYESSSKVIIVDGKEYQFSDEFEHNKATEVIAIRFKDGDTVDFKNPKSNKKAVAIRFSGIDTPEKTEKIADGMRIKTSGLKFKYANLASKHTKEKLGEAKKIWIIPQRTKKSKKDTTIGLTDRYNRIIGIVVYLTQDNKIICLNKELVEFGLARVQYISLDKNSMYYTENQDYYNLIKEAERKARKEEKGFWKEDIEEIF